MKERTDSGVTLVLPQRIFPPAKLTPKLILVEEFRILEFWILARIHKIRLYLHEFSIFVYLEAES